MKSIRVYSPGFCRAITDEKSFVFYRVLRAYRHGEQPNITGFDIKKLREAAGTPRYDPWERALVI